MLNAPSTDSRHQTAILARPIRRVVVAVYILLPLGRVDWLVAYPSRIHGAPSTVSILSNLAL